MLEVLPRDNPTLVKDLSLPAAGAPPSMGRLGSAALPTPHRSLSLEAAEVIGDGKKVCFVTLRVLASFI